MSAPEVELAPAKVNLCLHVTGRRSDGYHLLDSLVVFPRIGDLLEAEPARGLSLSLHGPFAGNLDAGPDNLVLRAAMLLAGPECGAALRLRKSLPVASGIGGGSADAAAALRLLARLWDVPLPSREAALELGADVPVCLEGRACRMSGIGERLAPVDLPSFWVVMVNPGVQLATGAIFGGLAARDNAPLPAPGALTDTDALVSYLRQQRNDLEAPAIACAPPIADVLAALSAQSGCTFARMSGSGATCFGLFDIETEAIDAAAALRRAAPRWWVVAAPVASAGAASAAGPDASGAGLGR